MFSVRLAHHNKKLLTYLLATWPWKNENNFVGLLVKNIEMSRSHPIFNFVI